MKHIVKNTEPQSLKTYRSTPNASFNDSNKLDFGQRKLGNWEIR